MTDTDLLRRILGAMHVGPPGPADIAWLAEKGLHALDAIEDQAAATERARIAERVRTRIVVLSQPDGRHIYRGDLHAEVANCGECGRLHEMRQFLAAIEGEPHA